MIVPRGRLWSDPDAEGPTRNAPREVLASSPEQESGGADVARLPLVDIHDRVEQLERLLLGTLERIAPDDRAEPAPGVDLAHVAYELLVGLPGSARENHDAPPVECGLNNMLHASRERLELDLCALVCLLGFGLLDRRSWRLDLDDIGTELRRDLSGVRHHVKRSLALLGERRPARV